jgi:hypothetical protein
MVDLQNCRLGGLGLELGYFFCSSTSPEQRKNHLDELLRFYYDQVTTFCVPIEDKFFILKFWINLRPHITSREICT